LENKINIAKDGIKFFEGKKMNHEAAQLYELLFEVKPDATLNEMFGATLANYRDSSYAKSRDYALKMIQKSPDQQFGWEWAFRNALVIDTVKKDSIMVPDAMNLLAFTQGDSVKFANQIRSASYPVALYYNEKKQLDSAIKYLELMRSATADVAQKQSIQNNINALREAAKKSKSSSNSNAGPAGRKPEG
jgi:hypothetical protein